MSDLIKTDYGYDYRGVAITRTKSGEFIFRFVQDFTKEFNYRGTLSMKLSEARAEIDKHLANGATVEGYRIKKR